MRQERGFELSCSQSLCYNCLSIACVVSLALLWCCEYQLSAGIERDDSAALG